MNTLVVYAAIILVIIIILVIVVSMKTKQYKSPMFAKVEGYDNIFKNLQFMNGLTVTEADKSLTKVDKSGDSLLSHLKPGSVMSTSTDTLLSGKEIVLKLDEHNLTDELNGGYDFMEKTPGSKFDKTKDYICAVYVKRQTSPDIDDGTIYWGVENELFLNGDSGQHRYFSQIPANDFVTGIWHLMIGVLRKSGTEITDTSKYTGTYILTRDKKKIDSTTLPSDFKMDITKPKTGLNTFLVYDDDDEDDQSTLVSFSRPFVYEVDEVTEDIMEKVVNTLKGE
jgi:hypothetical protein